MQPQPLGRETPPNVPPPGRGGQLFPPVPDQAARELGLAIHDHELVRRIGRGAYGEVWLARNALGTMRAIKIVYRQDFEDSRPFEREFAGIQKFEPISRSHPGLVNILQIGRREDYFYYVMELADAAEEPKAEARSPKEGRDPKSDSQTPKSEIRTSDFYRPRTLREDLRRNGRLPAEQCVEIGLALTSALAHLHQTGLVHRDVKPSNIIFVQGAAKLADIGLVTEAGDSQSIVGTEGYLPPEGPGTPQADIFSLGKVLYEISTGQDRRHFPDLPTDLKDWPDEHVVMELNEIVLRACTGAAISRYHSAEAMIEDLIQLRRGSSIKRRYIWQSRLKVARKSALVAAGLLVCLASGIWLRQAMIGARGIPPRVEERALETKVAKAAEAYPLGLPGLRRGTKEGFRQAKESFTAAVEADPGFVRGYARLFETYLMGEDHGLDVNRGKAQKLGDLSAKLDSLSPTNAETHAAAAIVLMINEWKWLEAEREFTQALKADPNCLMALTYYGYLLTRTCRPEEANRVLKRALALEPTSPLITKFLGHCEFVQRHYDRALNLYLHTSELEPSYPSGHYWAARAYLAMANYPEAVAEFEHYELQIWTEVPYINRRFRNYRDAVASGKLTVYWQQRLQENNDEGGAPYEYAEIYARLGLKQEALKWLETSLLKHTGAENVLFDEFWDSFRQDTRFKDIMTKMGIEAWAPRGRG